MLSAVIGLEREIRHKCVFRSMWAGDSIGSGHLIPL